MKSVIKFFIIVAMISIPLCLNSQGTTQPASQDQVIMETYSAYDFIACK